MFIRTTIDTMLWLIVTLLAFAGAVVDTAFNVNTPGDVKYLTSSVLKNLFLGGFLFWASVAFPASVIAANVTVDGAMAYQTMDGVGTNVNAWSWKKGELRPALDALVSHLGHNIFRVIHDRMEWAGTGSTRPATTLMNLQNLDPATLQRVYEVPDMQDLWNTITYLNSKGVTGDQIMVNFMGWTAPWMGGSGTYGIASTITNNAQTNQDIATMIASLVYYGHHRRDISGANENVSFSYIAPFNEIDWNGLEGPQLSPAQLNTIYANIITTLNVMGDSTTSLVGPDAAGGPDNYTTAFSAVVRARMKHFAWHSYSGSPAALGIPQGNIKADWMTETSMWCGGCDYNQPPTESEWSFGSRIGDLFLGDINNGFSAVLTWEGFDTFYYHHNSYSTWGHVGCTQNGSGCTLSDSFPRVYSIRGRAWPEATIAQGVKPGMKFLSTHTTLGNLTALAFSNATSGAFSLVGHNTAGSSQTLSVQLNNLPNIANQIFSMYFTNQNKNLEKQTDVTAVNGAFFITVPADTFFLITSTGVVPPNDTTPPILSNGAPSGTLPAGTSMTTMSVTANENATCRYSMTVGTTYAAMTNIFSTTGGMSHSTTLSGLTDGQSYTFFVRCRDRAGNDNPSDYPISFNVSAPAAFTYTLANGGNKSVLQGRSIAQSVSATLISGTTQSVSYSVSGLPSGATLSFPSCSPTCASTGTLRTTSSTPVGAYTITVTGTPDNVTTSFILTVQRRSRK